ncbi:MAG: asparagine synthase (glutamine-hydrolyzing) [Thermodesulfobacteriota bacterium]
MCGIAGYLGSREIGPDVVGTCLGLMHRRGPDATGFCRRTLRNGNRLYLLHSRLSIIDLDPRAGQPFRFGSKVIAFNGEIYNYVEVMQSLVPKGRAFRTTSDTEVLVQWLDEFGTEGLRDLEGMWAFALLDETDDSLLLARDRFGEKPLYLYEDQTGLYFGSEVKFLAALTGKRFRVNLPHLYRYLVNGYKSLYKVRETFFESVRELLPGNYLRVSAEGTASAEIQYWVPRWEPAPRMSYEEAVSGAREALIDSMKIRLRADVPIAFCMSGGVDSNALISIAKRIFGYDVHGFTITNTDERYAEQDLVDHAVAALGIRHTSIPVQTGDFLENLRLLIRYHDAPVYTVSYYAHWLLMRSIGEHGYRISVSGTGADELFTGYYDHHSMYLYEVRQEPELFRRSLENWKGHIAPIVRNPLLQDPLAFVKNPAQREHIYLEAEEFAACLTREFHEEFREVPWCAGLLRNRMLNELLQEAVPVILHEDDLNAMYFSIENRSPFLDRRLFEFCYSIPEHHLIRDGFNKKVLRDAMRGIVPDPVLDSRRKVGFNAPIFSFLNVKDRFVQGFLLEESPVFEHVRKEKVSDLLRKDFLPNSESKFLFNFLCAKIFLEEFD